MKREYFSLQQIIIFQQRDHVDLSWVQFKEDPALITNYSKYSEQWVFPTFSQDVGGSFHTVQGNLISSIDTIYCVGNKYVEK